MKDPEWTAIPETTPQAIKKLIYRCLQKDQRQRLQAIGDARITIEETLSGDADVEAGLSSPSAIGAPARVRVSPLSRALPWFGGILIGAIAAGLIGLEKSMWRF